MQLQWRDHGRDLALRLSQLRTRGSLLDLTLAAEGRSLRVHRAVMAAASSYFEVSVFCTSEIVYNVYCTYHKKSKNYVKKDLPVQDLLRDASGHQDPIIFFRDIRYTDLENLITFVYTGAVQVHTTDLFPANIFRSIKIFSNNYFSVVLHFDIIR